MPIASSAVSAKPNRTGFLRELRRAGDRILGMRDPLLVFHDDADGVASAAQVRAARASRGLKTRVLVARYEDDFLARKLRGEREIVFVDFGASFGRVIDGLRAQSVVVLDHHPPVSRPSRAGAVFVNPRDFGVSGDFGVCGSSMVFHALKHSGARGLARIATVGLSGDMQDRSLSELNEEVVTRGFGEGGVERVRGLRVFEGHLPLFKLLGGLKPLSKAGLSNAASRKRFLVERGFAPSAAYNDLSFSGQARLAAEIEVFAGEKGVGDSLKNFFGERFVLSPAKHAVMRDSQAFSSLVNAWVRAPARSQVEENANAEAAIDALLNCSRVRESLRLMRRRSEALLRAQRFARKNVRDMGGFYLVDGGRGFSRAFNVLGVVSTSLSHSLGSREAKPVFVLGSSKGRVELEARGTKELVEKGLDLSAIFVAAREARLLKRGGGHKVAAGAGGFAPSRKNAFFALVNRELSKQLSAGVN